MRTEGGYNQCEACGKKLCGECGQHLSFCEECWSKLSPQDQQEFEKKVKSISNAQRISNLICCLGFLGFIPLMLIFAEENNVLPFVLPYVIIVFVLYFIFKLRVKQPYKIAQKLIAKQKIQP